MWKQTLTLAVGFGLASCAPADAVEASLAMPPLQLDVDRPPSPELAHDVLTRVGARLDRLSEAEREHIAAATRVMATHCPYNRATMQLPQALLIEMSRSDASTLPPVARMQWAQLRSGLELHVSVLASLGATGLPLPAPGDYLHGEPAMIDSATLWQSADPLSATEQLALETRRLVAGFDAETQRKLDTARAVVRPHTGDADLLKWPILGWEKGLERLDAALGHHEAALSVRRMIEVTKTYTRQGC